MKATAILAFLGLMFLAQQASGVEFTSDGDSGAVCGPRDKKCIQGKAVCDPSTDKCECQLPYTHGRGDTNCYKNNTFSTEVTNDPNVMTYNGNLIGLPLPCRYFWTHTVTYLKKSRLNRVGYCEFQAYAIHQKKRGKFYVAGYDVAIRLMYNNGTEKTVSIRKHGIANFGQYDFVVNTTDNQYLPHGDWYNNVLYYYDPDTKLRIECEHDKVNNLAIINAKKCGISIQFRPYDEGLRQAQPQIPHIAYGVNCAYHPEFKNTDKVVALPPASAHNGFTIQDILIPGLNEEQTLIVRALNSMALQNSPQPNPECALSGPKLNNCDPAELVNAMNYCLFILKLPRFIRCYDKTDSGVHIMSLFNSCVDVFCDNGSCSDVIYMIKTSKCDMIKNPYAEVTDFVNGVYCS